MVKLVKKEQSSAFCQIYYNASVKYNHLFIWVAYKVCCWALGRKEKDNDCNLLKPLSRFYHFINACTVLFTWLITNCFFIACYWTITLKSDSISVAAIILVILLSSIFECIFILIFIKAFYSLYVKNIQESFENARTQQAPVFIQKKKPGMMAEKSIDKLDSQDLLKDKPSQDSWEL